MSRVRAASRRLVAGLPANLLTPRQTLAWLGIGVLAGGICFYFGADVWWSIIIGLAVLVLAATILVRPVHRSVQWPPPVGPDRAGTRLDVAELSWSLRTRYGRVGITALSRLQRLAHRRLGQRGLELRQPTDRAAIEELIGTGAYKLLTAQHGRMPTLRAYVHCLNRLDALDRDVLERNARAH